MYRVIAHKTVVTEGAGTFGHKAALHSTPRRYWKLTKAIERAQKQKGLYSVVDDNREVHAVVKNGKILGQRK